MEISFSSNSVFQAIIGAVQYPDKRDRLLGKISDNFNTNPGIPAEVIREGITQSVDMGLISEEEAWRLFKVKPEPADAKSKQP